jgi:hypothetical protein
MKTGQMRQMVEKAIKAGWTKDQFVARFYGSVASMAAREWELATLGYVVTPRKAN